MAEHDERLTVTIGRSVQGDTRRAAEEALGPLVSGNTRYDLILAYGSIDHDHRALVDVVARRAGDAPFMGCTTTGEITPTGVLEKGLVVTGLASPLLEAGVGFGRDVFDRPEAAAREAVEMAREALDARGGPERARKICIFHSSGFTLDHPGVEEDVLAAIQSSLGEEWLIVGGSSSDGARFLGSREWCGREVLHGGVVVALLSTDLEAHHDMAHGFVPTDESFEVTEARGNVVRKIEGQRADQLYAKLLGIKPKQLTKGLSIIRMTDKVPKFLTGLSQKAGLTPQMITEKIPFFTYALENPFGVRSGDSYVVKVPKVVTPEGGLEFQTRMDSVDRLYRMRLDRDATLSASARAIAAVKDAAADHPPAVTLVFECLGRYMHLHQEIDRLFRQMRSSSDAELVGFFCAAEQGTMQGVGCQTHNYTTSVLGLG